MGSTSPRSACSTVIPQRKSTSTNSINRTEAISAGLDPSPSSWSQWSQFISQLGFVVDSHSNTNLTLNQRGIELKEAVRNIYSVDELKKWESDCPQIVREIYWDALTEIEIENFTAIQKTFYCALNMLISTGIPKIREQEKPSDDELKSINIYFDIKPSTTNFNWVSQYGRILAGLGLATLTVSSSSISSYQPTPECMNLIHKIIAKFRRTDPEIFKDSHISFEKGISTGLVKFITFHQSFSYEDFIDGIRPDVNSEGELIYELIDGVFKNISLQAQKWPEHNYVLIIDEINRGNISKIFGELITLLETSKRIGSTEGEQPNLVTLPYSKESFSVPSNLYVIGTMNSTDRSITNIDVALRRRFYFKEMRPNYELITSSVTKNGESIYMRKILEQLNLRLEYLLDEEHVIGHSFFLKINTWEELCLLFRDQIIPLLKEFFYNDWEKIALALGDDNLSKKSNEKFVSILEETSSNIFASGFNSELHRDIYRLNADLVAGNFKNISEQLFLKSFSSNRE
jgi:hypothetical protein